MNCKIVAWKLMGESNRRILSLNIYR